MAGRIYRRRRRWCTSRPPGTLPPPSHNAPWRPGVPSLPSAFLPRPFISADFSAGGHTHGSAPARVWRGGGRAWRGLPQCACAGLVREGRKLRMRACLLGLKPASTGRSGRFGLRGFLQVCGKPAGYITGASLFVCLRSHHLSLCWRNRHRLFKGRRIETTLVTDLYTPGRSACTSWTQTWVIGDCVFLALQLLLCPISFSERASPGSTGS